VTLCIVAKRCVLQQKLLLRAYRKLGSRIWEIDWYQNEWPWPLLEVVSRSRQPLRYIWRWISRKPLEIEAWFERTTNRGPIWAIEWSSDVLKGQTRDPNTLREQYLENYLSNRLQIWYAALYGEWQAGAQIIFPESERGLDLCLDDVSGHLTGLRPEHPLLLSDFRIIKPSDCRHIMLLWGSTFGYPSDSLVSCCGKFELAFSLVYHCKKHTIWTIQYNNYGLTTSRTGSEAPRAVQMTANPVTK